MNRQNLLAASSSLLLFTIASAASVPNRANHFWDNHAQARRSAESDLGSVAGDPGVLGPPLTIRVPRTGTATGAIPGSPLTDDQYVIQITRSADIDVSGDIGFDDFLQVLWHWGPCESTPVGTTPAQHDCAADLNGDGAVGFDDLVVVLNFMS